jgi:predicted metalloprotease with PDZ domain
VEALEATGGEGLGAWLEPLVGGRAEPDLDRALAWYGLRLERHPEKAALEAAGAAIGAGFGINWVDEGPALVAAAVVHGSGAAEAGVLPGDELIAIDGERVTHATLEPLKDRLRPGETVEFLLARQGRMLTLPVTAGEARPRRYEIRPLDRVSDRQINRLQGWLGQRVVGR